VSAGEGLYEQVLAAGGGALPAARPPRPSASVVPWREGRAGLEVFWLRRGRALPFMGGWHAFPGGALDRADAERPVHGTPAGLAANGWTAASADPEEAPRDPDLLPGIVACALRELAEETGLAIVDGARLTFAGRWLTPPFSPQRFDNRFFLLAWRSADGEPAAVPPESESGEWIAPAAALARVERGEVLVAPPILHLLRVLGEAGPAAGRTRLLDPSEANLGRLRRLELRPGILLFPLAAATLPPASHTNSYLLGHGEAVLLDPGSPHESENQKLLEALAAAASRLGRRATAIWLTHHHPDHVAGVEMLRRALDLPVYAHALTAPPLARRGIAVDGWLHDGQRVRLAGDPAMTLRVHHTPGHTRGHLAIEIEETRDLLAGDLVAGLGTIVIDPPEGEMESYLASLERMRQLAPRTLFVGHGAPFLDATGKLAEYLAHRLARERAIRDAWRRGTRAPHELVEQVYPEVPVAIRPLAERQVLAHLSRLARRGELAD